MLGFADQNLDNCDLFLYELDGANLSHFSLTETLTYLSDGKLGLERTMVVGQSMPDLLTPTSLELFALGRDQYWLRASSAGRSILILPIEFSRCLKIADAAGGTPRPSPR